MQIVKNTTILYEPQPFLEYVKGFYSKKISLARDESCKACVVGVAGGTRTHDIQNHNLTL